MGKPVVQTDQMVVMAKTEGGKPVGKRGKCAVPAPVIQEELLRNGNFFLTRYIGDDKNPYKRNYCKY